MTQPKINLQYPIFPDITYPKGFLPRDIGAQACWYYYTLAQKLYEQLGGGIDDQFGLLETDMWMDPQYIQLARSIAVVYRLDSPSDYWNYWPAVEEQAASMGYPAPRGAYKNPMKIVIQ